MDSRPVSKVARIWLAGWIWRVHGEQINVPEVVRYIQNQRDRHRKKTFQDEYLEFLDKHGIEYDERYLWG